MESKIALQRQYVKLNGLILGNIDSQSIFLAPSNIEAECFIILAKLEIHSSLWNINIKAADKVGHATFFKVTRDQFSVLNIVPVIKDLYT